MKVFVLVLQIFFTNGHSTAPLPTPYAFPSGELCSVFAQAAAELNLRLSRGYATALGTTHHRTEWTCVETDLGEPT